MNPRKFLSTRYPFPATRFPRKSGQATLEFAIFFPLFALVIAMIIQFSWILFTKQRVEMATFRGTLYAAKQPQSVPINGDSVRAEILNFFPDQQQSSVLVNDFDRILGPDDRGIDYAELSVCADTHILGMFTVLPFTAMWNGIATASGTRATQVANRVRSQPNLDLNTSKTANKIEGCYDRYSGDTYTVCAFHKIAYDPNVSFSGE